MFITLVNHPGCHIDLSNYEWTSSFMGWFNSVICLCILCVMSWLTRLCVIFILLYVFVMYNSVRMTFHISTCFFHAQLCTNDYPYYNNFLSCTSLYKWLSISLNVFVMHVSLRMIILFPIYFQFVSIKQEYFYVYFIVFAGINRLGRATWYLSSQW